MSGAFHLVRPYWPGELDDEERSVDSLYHAPSFLEEAIELWRLAGDAEHAEQIREVTEPAYERSDLTLHTPEIQALIEAIGFSRLKQALIGSGLVDECLIIVPDRLSEVRGRVERVQVGEHRGSTARYGVSEAVSRVYELCAFLQRALDEGLHVALD